MFGNEVLLARWWFGENLYDASDGALIKRNALWDVVCSKRECRGTEIKAVTHPGALKK